MTVNQLIQALKDLQKELAETQSNYQGEYGEGYDTGKHGAADSLETILEQFES